MAEATDVRRLNVFERYLTLWVALCMVVGIGLGKLLPGLTDALRRIEFGGGSQINIPIAVLIKLVIEYMVDTYKRSVYYRDMDVPLSAEGETKGEERDL